MGIVLLVTGDTFGRRFSPFFTNRMAALAGRCGVGAFQSEVRHVVTKRLFIEADDIGLAALMIGVAVAAFGIFDAGRLLLRFVP